MQIIERKKHVEKIRRFFVSQYTAFHSVAGYVNSYVTTGEFITKTDGRTVRVGSLFFDLEETEQAAHLMKSILQVALRHVERGRRHMHESRNNWELWMLASQVITWSSLKKLSWIQIPENAPLIDKVIRPEVLEQITASRWTVDHVYRYLLEEAKKAMEQEGQGQGAGQGEGQESGQGQGLSFIDPRDLADRSVKDLETRGIVWADDMDGGRYPHKDAENGEVSDEMRTHLFNQRLNRAAAGDKPDGVFRELFSDFPETKTPWHKIMQSWMRDAVMPTTEHDPSKPSRRTIVSAMGRHVLYAPGIKPNKGIKSLGIIFDLSGSIGDDIFMDFAAQVDRLQRDTGCSLFLVTHDTEAYFAGTVEPDGRGFVEKCKDGSIKFQGGGGTSFTAAHTMMSKYKVNACVHLTDLICHEYPDPNTLPYDVLWAVRNDQRPEAPFGRTVHLDLYE